MAFLEGNITGTQQNDAIAGSEQRSVAENANWAGIYNATINSFQGEDSIEGIAELTASEGVSLGTYGIINADIFSGRENDKISGVARSSNANGKGNSRSFGLQKSTIRADEGGDNLSFLAQSLTANSGYAIGANDSDVFTDLGDDTLSVSSEATANSSAVIYAARNARFEGNQGADNFSFDATAQTTGANGISVVRGLETSDVNSGADADELSFSASSSASQRAIAYTINNNSFVSGGDGNDQITLSAEADSGRSSGTSEALATGVKFDSSVLGELGNDTINISANVVGDQDAETRGIATGIDRGLVNGGGNNDAITVEAQSRTTGQSVAYGVRNSPFRGVFGGDADDTISISAIANSTTDKAFAYGAADAEVTGGSGNDRITLAAIATAAAGGEAYGALRSNIEGEAGNDIITISSDGIGTLDFQDALISGGDEDDVIDAGIGSGTISGGRDSDRVILDFFNQNTMSITAIDSGVQISGTQAKNGTALSWSQDIIEVEQFSINGTLYSAEGLVNTFA